MVPGPEEPERGPGGTGTEITTAGATGPPEVPVPEVDGTGTGIEIRDSPDRGTEEEEAEMAVDSATEAETGADSAMEAATEEAVVEAVATEVGAEEEAGSATVGVTEGMGPSVQASRYLRPCFCWLREQNLAKYSMLFTEECY